MSFFSKENRENRKTKRQSWKETKRGMKEKHKEELK